MKIAIGDRQNDDNEPFKEFWVSLKLRLQHLFWFRFAFHLWRIATKQLQCTFCQGSCLRAAAGRQSEIRWQSDMRNSSDIERKEPEMHCTPAAPAKSCAMTRIILLFYSLTWSLHVPWSWIKHTLPRIPKQRGKGKLQTNREILSPPPWSDPRFELTHMTESQSALMQWQMIPGPPAKLCLKPCCRPSCWFAASMEMKGSWTKATKM